MEELIRKLISCRSRLEAIEMLQSYKKVELDELAGELLISKKLNKHVLIEKIVECTVVSSFENEAAAEVE